MNENYAEIKSNLEVKGGGFRDAPVRRTDLWKVKGASKALYAAAQAILKTLKGEGHG